MSSYSSSVPEQGDSKQEEIILRNFSTFDTKQIQMFLSAPESLAT